MSYLIHEVRRVSDDVLLLHHFVDDRGGFQWDFPLGTAPADPWYECWRLAAPFGERASEPRRVFAVEAV